MDGELGFVELEGGVHLGGGGHGHGGLGVEGTAAVAAFLLVQVIYKMISPMALGGFRNPVVISNLGIAAFHAVTLWTICQSTGNPFLE